jgi:predicted CDP-diglyceride synthetase/phosphatidate cytidylyltransferase
MARYNEIKVNCSPFALMRNFLNLYNKSGDFLKKGEKIKWGIIETNYIIYEQPIILTGFKKVERNVRHFRKGRLLLFIFLSLVLSRESLF